MLKTNAQMDLISERNKVFDWLPTEVKDYFPKKKNHSTRFSSVAISKESNEFKFR